MPEGDYGINFVDADKWYAMQKDGETVIVLHDPSPYVSEPAIDKPAQIITKRPSRGWEGLKEITETEAESLDALCGVPTIELHQFHKWEEIAYPTKVPPKGWWKKIVNKTLKREN